MFVLLIQTNCFFDVLGAVAIAVAIVDAKLPNISHLPKVYIYERTQLVANKSERFDLYKWTTRVVLF